MIFFPKRDESYLKSTDANILGKSIHWHNVCKIIAFLSNFTTNDILRPEQMHRFAPDVNVTRVKFSLDSNLTAVIQNKHIYHLWRAIQIENLKQIEENESIYLHVNSFDKKSNEIIQNWRNKSIQIRVTVCSCGSDEEEDGEWIKCWLSEQFYGFSLWRVA